MLAQLLLLGFGPHDDFDLDLNPSAWTEIGGASETGKSSILDGTIFALFGCDPLGGPFDVSAIRDGGDRAEVALTTAKGTTIRRSMTRSRSTTRRMTRAGVDTNFGAEADLQKALGVVGAKPDVARAVMVPMSWVPLLERELGRPLRDLLTRILPDADPRARAAAMMADAGFELRETDDVHEAGAKGGATLANRARDEARGALDAARARKPAQAPAGPSAEALNAARGILEASRVWRDHDAAMDRFHVAVANRERQVKARDEYRARRAAMGERPTQEPGALQAHRATVERLAREHDAAQRAEFAARDAEAAAQLARDNAARVFVAAREQGSNCPTCKRGGWEEAADAFRRAQDDGLAKKQALDAAQETHAARRDDTARARAALEAAKEAGAEIEAAAQACAAYDAGLRALGGEPPVDVPPTEPAAPTVLRPTVDQVTAATGTLADDQAAAGARRLAESEAARAAKGLADAEAAFERAEAEAKRCAALVDIVRRVPSEIARDQAAALGELGCVSLRFPPVETKTTPVIEVLIDGRPWRRASTGKQVLADLHLRAAIRRLAKMPSLPIFVDRAQDWSGAWPVDSIPGPVVLLRTTQDETLTVTAFGAAMAAK